MDTRAVSPCKIYLKVYDVLSVLKGDHHLIQDFHKVIPAAQDDRRLQRFFPSLLASS